MAPHLAPTSERASVVDLPDELANREGVAPTTAITLSDEGRRRERAQCRRSVLERSLRYRLLETGRTGRSERLATSDPSATGVYGFCRRVRGGRGAWRVFAAGDIHGAARHGPGGSVSDPRLGPAEMGRICANSSFSAGDPRSGWRGAGTCASCPAWHRASSRTGLCRSGPGPVPRSRTGTRACALSCRRCD